MEQMKTVGTGGTSNIYIEDVMSAREEIYARVIRQLVNWKAEESKAKGAEHQMYAAGPVKPVR